MSKIIIAIDPDIDKSGVAVWKDEKLSLYNLSFGELLDFIKNTLSYSELVVIVEAGWLNKSNWHTKAHQSGYYSSGQIGSIQAKASKMGECIGANHQTGKLILEIAKMYGAETIEQKPLAKIWKGRNCKITHDELKRIAPDLKKTTNQEQRDAALLALSYLNKVSNKIAK